MRTFLVLFTLILCGIVAVSGAHAQSTIDGPRWGVGIAGGISIGVSEGDEIAPNLSTRLYLRYAILQQLHAELGAGYMVFEDTDSYLGLADVKTDLIPVDLRVLFTPWSAEKISPYFFVGLGIMNFSANEVPAWKTPGSDTSGTVLSIPIGAGVNFEVADDLRIDFQVGNTLSLGDDLNPIYDDVNDAVWSVMAGVTYTFGRENDGSDYELYSMEEVDQGIVLPNIYFATGSATITPESRRTLRKVLNTLKQFPEIRVEIQGHTDSTGAYDMNVKLSLDRAESVKKWMVDNGVAADRMTSRGFGPDKPVATNTTAEGRQRNRRIEMVRIK